VQALSDAIRRLDDVAPAHLVVSIDAVRRLDRGPLLPGEDCAPVAARRAALQRLLVESMARAATRSAAAARQPSGAGASARARAAWAHSRVAPE
jgi:hypothetical protein